ncbi:hypothetical protein CP554_28615 [Klebsiella pneumoniae]|uniref:Uncharacterized protein n=1 Tax=Klebsiella pneumoniae TaxID=573 RepID=A0AAX1BJT7_KLEPN|nr:hypothetical protein CP554_28615 [Klebsiella pneumoniae]
MALDNAPRLITSNHPVPVIISRAIQRRNSVNQNIVNLHEIRTVIKTILSPSGICLRQILLSLFHINFGSIL